MKIMTFNTQHCANFVTGRIDYEVMADAIKKCGAELVGLNEMRDKGVSSGYDTAQTEKLSELTGLEHFYFAKAIEDGPGNPYGNGILSAYKLESVEKIMIREPGKKAEGAYYERRCILKAKLENGLTVLVTHFGLSPEEQECAVTELLEHITEEKCILMGDFNVKPDNKVLEPIRAKMKDTADLFGEEKLSFPSDKPIKKIDYIFVSPDIEVVSADIPEIVASDHRPHTAVIKL